MELGLNGWSDSSRYSRPRHFDTRALQLKIDDVGAQFWSVALEQTQLTYFEVGPHCRFESTATEASR